MCNEKGIQLFLIKTPSYKPKWGSVFEEDIKNVANENGLMYVNFDAYSAMMGIDWPQDTPDNGRHLNLYGAEKYSYFLGSVIYDHFDTVDRRDDSEYNSIWNEKVIRYDNDKIN